MEAKGIRTEKGELNRWIKATNRLMQDVRKKIKALFVWMAEVKEELSKPQTPNLADLLIAYYNQRNAGAWSNKARTGNLKQFAEAVNYLTENKLLTLEDLQERLSSVSEEFEALSGSMKKKSARIKELKELIREGENYQRLKPVNTELNNIKFKNMINKYFPDEKIEVDDLYFVCYMIERVARQLKQRNRYVVNSIGRTGLYHLISCAETLHCENPDKVADDWIRDYNLTEGNFDITAVDPELADVIPTALDMGEVYQRLIVDTLGANEDYIDGILRVYNNPICDVIDNYNCSAFYEPSYVIARAYQNGGF